MDLIVAALAVMAFAESLDAVYRTYFYARLPPLVMWLVLIIGGNVTALIWGHDWIFGTATAGLTGILIHLVTITSRIADQGAVNAHRNRR